MGKWGLNVSVRPHFFCLLDRSFISICWDLNSFFSNQVPINSFQKRFYFLCNCLNLYAF